MEGCPIYKNDADLSPQVAILISVMALSQWATENSNWSCHGATFALRFGLPELYLL